MTRRTTWRGRRFIVHEYRSMARMAKVAGKPACGLCWRVESGDTHIYFLRSLLDYDTIGHELTHAVQFSGLRGEQAAELGGYLLEWFSEIFGSADRS